MLMKPLSGNSRDPQAFGQVIHAHINQLQTTYGATYLVADSALDSEANLDKLAQTALKWITRVPATVSDAQLALAHADPPVMASLQEGYRSHELTSSYGGVEQRWVLIDSEARQPQAQRTADKQLRQQTDNEVKAFKTLCSTAFACEADARQALSDGKEVYIFRQAIASDTPHMVYTKDKDGHDVPIVDQILMVDRFIFVDGQLKPKLEVRYQRSRKRDLPASRKDTLGYEDLEKQPFYEPTATLTFIKHLADGRFSVLLLPTSLPDVQRWQLFAYNLATRRIDSFNIERGNDGLFNTRGTCYYTSADPQHQNDVFERSPGIDPFTGQPLVPIISEAGFAETALEFDGRDDHVVIPHSTPLDFTEDQDFTLEIWLKPAPSDAPEHVVSILEKGDGSGGYPYALRYQSRAGNVVAARSDGSTAPVSLLSTIAINDGNFHHVALVKAGATLSLLIDGIAAATASDTTGSGARNSAPLHLASRGGTDDHFKGQIDEVRIWRRARLLEDLRDDLHHRLIGDEPDLVGYWRFDEGSGLIVHDQTDNAQQGRLWVGIEKVQAPDRISDTLLADAAFMLDGQNDDVEIPSDQTTEQINFDANAPFTLEAWVRADSAQADLRDSENSVIDKGSRGNSYPYMLHYLNSGAAAGKSMPRRRMARR
jgi:Concanavalin A-like lectin/glucanases superfamily